ncbi:hypothetical protein HAP48_0025260 [Bradyrhizobium septentrionale]|uniref:Uncharacterized protein n=1 Tax=Bradyrhizobium septentrionale TaxID=1404411 RepID=A0A973VWM9_9BRAD|nr:hypothetical protein [Bradyrhizobium septentrionale]UGY12059.1 hypothetical protein HAP48_0025260 [Bradyrhizobium septentrionale]UGY29244.1 hypothetical protein HU675_0022465 [Bradyrhizobium septentrionale]
MPSLDAQSHFACCGCEGEFVQPTLKAPEVTDIAWIDVDARSLRFGSANLCCSRFALSASIVFMNDSANMRPVHRYLSLSFSFIYCSATRPSTVRARDGGQASKGK